MSAAACGRSPMAAIDGVTLARLSRCSADVDGRARQHAHAGRRLRRARDARRVSARAWTQARREAAERRDGRRGGAPLRFEWSPLGVDVPFHSPALAAPLARFEAWAGRRGRCRPGRRCSASSVDAGAVAVRRAGALGRGRAPAIREPRRRLGARPRPGHRGRAADGREPARQRRPDARARLARGAARADLAGRGAGRRATSPTPTLAPRRRRAARRPPPPRHALHAG